MTTFRESLVAAETHRRCQTRPTIAFLGPGKPLLLDPRDAAAIVLDMQQGFVHNLGAFRSRDRTPMGEIIGPTARFLPWHVTSACRRFI